MERLEHSARPARRLPRLSLTALAVVACTWVAEPASAQLYGPRNVTVMTRNLYFGASLDGLMTAATPYELLVEVAAVWQAVQDTNFRERAAALADEIAAERPLLIGLQEAALWRIQEVGDLLSGGTVPATQVVYDFVEILRSELAARGMHYEVVISLDDLDAELPSLTGADIRLTDRDVILARADLPPWMLHVLRTDSDHYDAQLQLPIGGGAATVTILRGWVAADVWARGKLFRFVSTHLEDDPFPTIQEAQAAEFLEGPADVWIPVVAVGDLNSNAAGPGTDSYQMLLDDGFEDAWAVANPTAPGLTWGHEPGLLNTSVAFTQRIDFVLYRGRFDADYATVVGDELGDRTTSGLWPSDHGGVVSQLRLRRWCWWSRR